MGREIFMDSKQDGGIDLIHSNTYAPAISGQICSRLLKIPHIVTFHDVYQASNGKFWKEWKNSQEMNLPFYVPMLSKIVEKLILRLNVSCFHTVSEMSKEDLMAFGVKGEKISVIPNGIDKADYQTSRDDLGPDEPFAVFVGRLDHYKNLQTVIRAFKEVVKAIPNATLAVIGDGPYKNNLIEEAKDIKDSVIFTGKVDHYDKIRIISQARFMVFPSTIEGFGIAAIEAFACYKPVLVPDIRPLSDIVKDQYSGFVIPAFDTAAWAERMIELFQNNELCKELGNNAYEEFSTQYEISRVVDKIELLYKDVAKNGSTS
jgi:glycosyltransferase involved in cell wall biosynthesis